MAGGVRKIHLPTPREAFRGVKDEDPGVAKHGKQVPTDLGPLHLLQAWGCQGGLNTQGTGWHAFFTGRRDRCLPKAHTRQCAAGTPLVLKAKTRLHPMEGRYTGGASMTPHDMTTSLANTMKFILWERFLPIWKKNLDQTMLITWPPSQECSTLRVWIRRVGSYNGCFPSKV